MRFSYDGPPDRSSAQSAPSAPRQAGSPVQRTKGSAILEAALFIPIIFALFIGMEELARVTYNYYMIQKTLSGLARYLGTQQGVNFCNGTDPILTAPWSTTRSPTRWMDQARRSLRVSRRT